jgi:hypothetical protein
MTRKKKDTGSADRVNAADGDSLSAALEQYGCALTGVFFADEATAVTAGYQPYTACWAAF